jgi:hypothetical protein
LNLLRKSFDRVSGNKPSGFQIIFFKQIEQPGNAYFTCKQTAGNIVRRVLAAIRS